MHDKLIFRLHQGLSRLGPGSPECTQKAFSYVKDLPDYPDVLDLGSGTGAQTIELLKICKGCNITAVDIYRPFLDELEKNTEKSGFSGRVKTVCASIDNLLFREESFDLIWAEGSVFIMGFSAGITCWKKFIKPGGYLALTELIWFTDTPSDEAASFWNKNYPRMGDDKQALKRAEDAGYEVVTSFNLPKSAWDNYLQPLEKNLNNLKEEYKGTAKGDKMMKITEDEIKMFQKYHDDYGYRFFILKKTY